MVNPSVDPGISTPILLRSGDAECEIWPDKGGSIARWTIAGQNMFRATVPGARADALPTRMASFPLVPFSNRIGSGRFNWNDNPVQLKLNAPPELHSLHGTGWIAGWNTAALTENTAVLSHEHHPDQSWPWHFFAEQHISMTDDMLTINMVASNLSDRSAPLAFGHHPAFDSKGAKLTFRASTVWRTGDNGLPAFSEMPKNIFDFTGGARVDERMLDNGYAGWDGRANICWDNRLLQLDIISDVRAAVVYVPKDARHFCFEPVPHIINALNLPGQQPSMPIAAPGASVASNIQFITSAV